MADVNNSERSMISSKRWLHAYTVYAVHCVITKACIATSRKLYFSGLLKGPQLILIAKTEYSHALIKYKQHYPKYGFREDNVRIQMP